MKHRALAAVAALALAAPGMAPAQSAEDIRAAAERYVSLPAVQEMIEAMNDPALLAHQMRAYVPGAENVPREQFERMAAIVAEELDSVWPAFERAMVNAAVKHFTLRELQEMTAYAESPVGRSVMRKTPAFTMDAAAAAGPQVQQAAIAAMRRIMEETDQ